MDLRLRQPRFAPWAALGLVLVPPWVLFVLVLIGMLDFEGTWSEDRWFLFCFRVILGLHLLSDLTLSLWAPYQLHHRFRIAAADRFEGVRPRTPWSFVVRRGLRWAAAPVVLAALLGLFHLEENWRGARTWAALTRELASRGERLQVDWPSPPAVPPEQNFGAAPIFSGLRVPSSPGPRGSSLSSVSLSVNGRPRGYVTWDQERSWTRQKMTDLKVWENEYCALKLISTNSEPRSVSANVLFAFRRFDPQIEELHEASRRPFCAPPVPRPPGWPNLLILCNVSELLRYRASAELAEGQVQEAFEDIKLCLRLAELIEDEPNSQAQLLRTDLLGAALQPVWEGLAQGCWPDEDLLWFQDRFAEFDLLSEYPRMLRTLVLQQMDYWRQRREDRARRTGLWRLTRAFSPVGWTYREQAGMYRLYRSRLTDLVDPKQNRVFPAKAEAALNAPQNLTYFQLSSGYQIPALTRELALVQTGLNQAVVACALERYRMAVGRYPETLDKLWPRYLDRLPNDLCNGRPLHYLRPSAQDFVLYSVGWNEQDDSGVSRNEADWVWKYPPK